MNKENWPDSESLYERLKKYGKSDYYPFHMPGHKRKDMVFENPFDWDITELDGFDDLHHPTGILKEAMEEAAAFYQSDASYFLVNGSSCGILAAISAAVHPGDKLLMARNCHKSVYHGALVNQLETAYLYPDILEDFSCAGGITAEQTEAALRQDVERKIGCVVMTSPTYEGLVSDVEKIAGIVHSHGAILIVDEAHGAHFPFHPAFPRSALTLGADAVIQSLHKTLPSLTQTALLHIRGDRIDRNRIETYLRVYQSSSPSYVLLASIDQCIRFMTGSRGKEAVERYVEHLTDVRQKLSGLKQIRLLDERVVGNYGIYGLDPGKLVLGSVRQNAPVTPFAELSVGGACMTGKELYRRLRERYHLQPEMCTDRSVTLMTSVNDSRQGFDRLLEAVEETDREMDQKMSRKSGRESDNRQNNIKTEKRMKIEENTEKPIARLPIFLATAASCELIPLEESQGRIAAELVCPYPPGIPILVPGEEITEACADRVKAYLEQGFEIHGIIRTGGNRFQISVLK